MKKLAFITRNMKAGGAERVISQLANYFSQKGIQCIIVTLDKDEVFYQLDSSIKVYAIGKKSNNKYNDKFLRYKELRRYINIEKPDIVLALPEEIGIFVIPALMGTNIPVIVSERNNPWVMPWKKETRLMRKLFYPFASGFIFQTEQSASFFSERIRNKGVVLPNPLDLNRVPESWKGERRYEIVSAGRLVRQKNFSLLIKAFAKFHKTYPEYVLNIYGEGELKEDLQNLAASILPEGSFSFPGNTSELLERIRGASMFVLSSDYEGMPNVLIEAMAMGIPVISTDCPAGGPAELIENGINGLLVPVGDVDALSEAMCYLVDMKKVAAQLARNAERIKEKLDCNVTAEKWIEYLNSRVS
jgi:glycosyltransferase involved in cell wall biosynthesis